MCRLFTSEYKTIGPERAGCCSGPIVGVRDLEGGMDFSPSGKAPFTALYR